MVPNQVSYAHMWSYVVLLFEPTNITNKIMGSIKIKITTDDHIMGILYRSGDHLKMLNYCVHIYISNPFQLLRSFIKNARLLHIQVIIRSSRKETKLTYQIE